MFHHILEPTTKCKIFSIYQALGEYLRIIFRCLNLKIIYL